MLECGLCDTCPFDVRAKHVSTFYEIHVTVETDDVERFIEVCKSNKIKPIVIEYQHHLTRQKMTQVMTSQRVFGGYRAMKEELTFIVNCLTNNRFKVVRQKVETTPDMYDKVEGCYFESHFAFKIRQGYRLLELRQHAKQKGMHISKNAFNKEGDLITMMGTIRKTNMTNKEFEKHVYDVSEYMREKGFHLGKTIIEYCVFDNKEKLDEDWMGV